MCKFKLDLSAIAKVQYLRRYSIYYWMASTSPKWIISVIEIVSQVSLTLVGIFWTELVMVISAGAAIYGQFKWRWCSLASVINIDLWSFSTSFSAAWKNLMSTFNLCAICSGTCERQSNIVYQWVWHIPNLYTYSSWFLPNWLKFYT